MHNRFLMTHKNGTEFKGLHSFQMKDPDTKSTFWSSNRGIHYILNKETKNLHSTLIKTTEGISSKVDEKLNIDSKSRISIKGVEGTTIEASHILFSADLNIFLKSINGSAYIVGNNVTIDMKNIPTVQSDLSISNDNYQYKLCLCYPAGKLFKVSLSKISNFRDICKQFQTSPCL
jgi:beta-sarcoglycan